MPTVKVQQQSNLAPEECFKRISGMLENDADLRRLDGKYRCEFDKATLTGRAEGSQFKAQLRVNAQGAGTMVEISVDLPFHLSLAKGLVQKTLEKKLGSALA